MTEAKSSKNRLTLIRQTLTDVEKFGHRSDWGQEADLRWCVGEIERLNRFADFLCRQDWTSRGRVIAEEAFMNAIAMDKEAGFPQPESRDG